jgi:hypothetical protein
MMRTSLLRSLIGSIISMLGGIMIMIGFFLPVYFTFPPINPTDTNPYPPMVNGWQILSLPSFDHSFGHPFFVLLFMAVIILCASLLILFQKGSLLVPRTRLLVSFVCAAMLVYFGVFSLLVNWNDSPDGAAASPTFALGPGCRVLLLGIALSAFGMAFSALGWGSVSMVALIGAFLGTLIGMVIGFSLNFIPWGLIPWSIREPFMSMIGYIDPYLGSMILGSILGGWVFLRVNRFFRDRDNDLEAF